MLNLVITETRDFVKKLLMEDIFDHFLVMEAYVKSKITYSFDGRLNKDFYDSEEIEALPSSSFVAWSDVRPHVYNVIRGKKLPLAFRIVMILSDADIYDLVEKNHLPVPASDIANLTLNIYYDGKGIHITSLASLNIFSLDKVLEHTWDFEIKNFLKKNCIFFEED